MAETKSAKPEPKKPKAAGAKKTGAKAKEKEEPRHSTFREYYVTTAVMTIFALFVTTYVVHPMTVPTPSMVPTILVGDRLLIDKFTVRNGFIQPLPLTAEHQIKRGDIIVFKYPKEPEVLYVKRAIGLPGETIEVRNKQVYINGQPIEEPYKVHSRHFFTGLEQGDNMPPQPIPAGFYFMLGDNRNASFDSRHFGSVKEESIVGKVLVVYGSIDSTCVFGKPA